MQAPVERSGFETFHSPPRSIDPNSSQQHQKLPSHGQLLLNFGVHMGSLVSNLAGIQRGAPNCIKLVSVEMFLEEAYTNLNIFDAAKIKKN